MYFNTRKHFLSYRKQFIALQKYFFTKTVKVLFTIIIPYVLFEPQISDAVMWQLLKVKGKYLL